MLLVPDKKKVAASIVSAMRPEKPADESVSPEEEEMAPDAVAAKAVISAIEGKDPKKLASALRELVQMCMGNEEVYGSADSLEE